VKVPCSGGRRGRCAAAPLRVAVVVVAASSRCCASGLARDRLTPWRLGTRRGSGLGIARPAAGRDREHRRRTLGALASGPHEAPLGHGPRGSGSGPAIRAHARHVTKPRAAGWPPTGPVGSRCLTPCQSADYLRATCPTVPGSARWEGAACSVHGASTRTLSKPSSVWSVVRVWH
jgi:hypothetical protein